MNMINKINTRKGKSHIIIRKSFLTASVLPVLVGTTLPFWLDPPEFKFKWFLAILFLIATVICHYSFILLHIYFSKRHNENLESYHLLKKGITGLIISMLIGLYMNSLLLLNKNVNEYIFIVYGLSVMFAGLLFVFPPFYFSRRWGGETVLAVGLGMMPALGAYLIQAGDLTRTVYLASLPMVFSTGLWIWNHELFEARLPKKQGYKTTVWYFPYIYSSRYVTLMLIFLIYASLLLAVFGRPSLSPFSLLAVFTFFFAVKVAKITWYENGDAERLKIAEKHAFLIHFTIGMVIIASSIIYLW